MTDKHPMPDMVGWMMDEGMEPDLRLLTAMVGPEEAQKKLEEWRSAAAARRISRGEAFA